VRGKRGRPRRRPDTLFADRAYDSDPHREALRQRGIRPFIARRRTTHGSGLGTVRWVVERSNSWLHQFRRLRTRWERRADIHEAFLTLACALISYRRLNSF
jgi:transposase